MADETKSPDFEAVASGPEASDPGAAAVPDAAVADAGSHPSVAALLERFPDAVRAHEVQAGGQHVVRVAPERNLEILGFLRDDPHHRYDLLADVTAVDWGGGRPLDVVYQLWSIPHRRALRVKCELPLTDLRIESAAGLWPSANWVEREVYDMFGIEFLNHPDLRRILMPENYAEGHPLRKDFPLRGRFSRAEQTRLALRQDLEAYYVPAELEGHGTPQVLEGGPAKRERADADPSPGSEG